MAKLLQAIIEAVNCLKMLAEQNKVIINQNERIIEELKHNYRAVASINSWRME